MRRVLVLGGTGWLGQEIVRHAVAGGAEVVCLARGESGPAPAGARLVRADRRSPSAYDEVRGDWDEVIELTYEPHLVRPALDALAERAAHWTLISSVSVYSRNDEPGADESAALAEPIDLREYQDAKVAAERMTASRLGERLLTVRPGLIVGPGDPSDRFGYWPARLARGGAVLAPTTTGRFVQVIDVDDLATWVEVAGRAGMTGAINAVGEPHSMADVLRIAARATGFDGELVSVDDDTLRAHDIRYWAGPRSLPLWLPAHDTGFAQRSGAAYRDSGGALRSVHDTVVRTLDDERAKGLDRERRSGLTPAVEAAVLRHVVR